MTYQPQADIGCSPARNVVLDVGLATGQLSSAGHALLPGCLPPVGSGLPLRCKAFGLAPWVLTRTVQGVRAAERLRSRPTASLPTCHRATTYT